jgi:hypothetical protein
MSPYRLTWVVAYSRDYDPSWRDFELTISGFHPLMVSLRRFDKDQHARLVVGNSHFAISRLSIRLMGLTASYWVT